MRRFLKRLKQYCVGKKEEKPVARIDENESFLMTENLSDIFQIVEVQNASPFVNDLFKRKFNSDAPNYPRHFVALYSRDGRLWTSAGYVHYSPYKTFQLCGGLVMDERVYRRMAKPHRELLQCKGGIAEMLLRESFTQLETDVIWGYVGDKRAEKVDLRVGFEFTHLPKIMAVWKKNFSVAEKIALADEIKTLGVEVQT